jgi:hypothetical protein
MDNSTEFYKKSGKIALVVASSGIATLLLPGGRTSYSRFKIPLEIKQNSMCNVKKHTSIKTYCPKFSDYLG